ncbi:hypothetical protein ABZ934_08785 [Streptomyces sp. NPDC046557]|uniref:hypothetical protein n=1 Tax=Streptomyces sp. NPDC046557 TaxID=3155372 RepID=UPI0033DA9224
MLRRLVAGLAAIVLVVEAAVLVLVHVVLGKTTQSQSMSIAGSDPELMAKATYGLGAAMGAFLLFCAVLLAVIGVRDRAPGRLARVVLVVCAVTHGVLGALALGLVGWGAFAVLMVILCLLVLTLVLYPGPQEVRDAPPPGFKEFTPTNP